MNVQLEGRNQNDVKPVASRGAYNLIIVIGAANFVDGFVADAIGLLVS